MDISERAALVVVGLWLAVCLLTLNYSGPFFDEAIYITAGQRTLQGYGLSDGYLRWFAGSLLWPALAGLGYRAGGLLGARAVALLCATVAFLAVVRAARNLFGGRAAFWTAVALALSAPFLALARLAVLDLPGLAGVAVSLWAVSELARSDDRGWLLIAAGGLALAVFSKYPLALMAVPLLGVLWAERPTRAAMDSAILGTVSVAVGVAFYLPVRAQVVEFLGWRAVNAPTFGTTPLMAWYARLYYLGAPLLLGLVGWFAAAGRRRLASVLLLSLALWPAYHALAGNAVSESKHIVFGLLFAAPLAGLGFSRLWAHRGGKAAVVAILPALGALAYLQVGQLSRAWPDLREPAGYLAGQVQPGEKLLINEAWPFTMALYSQGRIAAPWDVFDAYRLTHGQSTLSLCDYDWFVDVESSYPWPPDIRAAVDRCGRFRPVYTATRPVTGLGPDLRFATHPVRITIWRNTARRAAR